MKVKVGEKIYDSKTEPIMVILGDDDKYNIAKMHDDCETYCAYPETMSDEEAYKFMGIE